MASLRTFARKVAADGETWRNLNQTWARANFSFFIYFLFQIKWHFELFFLLKNGGWISTLSTPPVSAPDFMLLTSKEEVLNFQKNPSFDCHCEKILNSLKFHLERWGNNAMWPMRSMRNLLDAERQQYDLPTISNSITASSKTERRILRRNSCTLMPGIR